MCVDAWFWGEALFLFDCLFYLVVVLDCIYEVGIYGLDNDKSLTDDTRISKSFF